MNDSKTNWCGTVSLGQKTVKKTHFRLQFACKRKRAAAKSRGPAQKIEHCSKQSELMRLDANGAAQHRAS